MLALQLEHATRVDADRCEAERAVEIQHRLVLLRVVGRDELDLGPVGVQPLQGLELDPAAVSSVFAMRLGTRETRGSVNATTSPRPSTATVTRMSRSRRSSAASRSRTSAPSHTAMSSSEATGASLIASRARANESSRRAGAAPTQLSSR